MQWNITLARACISFKKTYRRTDGGLTFQLKVVVAFVGRSDPAWSNSSVPSNGSVEDSPIPFSPSDPELLTVTFANTLPLILTSLWQTIQQPFWRADLTLLLTREQEQDTQIPERRLFQKKTVNHGVHERTCFLNLDHLLVLTFSFDDCTCPASPHYDNILARELRRTSWLHKQGHHANQLANKSARTTHGTRHVTSGAHKATKMCKV